mmetsp:Transcript_47316/g.103038  ORF Transcript_47316/g.103038 Transcript_47316/m.103038 type:complete len:198 (+) Transcript_47316:2-595(+)
MMLITKWFEFLVWIACGSLWFQRALGGVAFAFFITACGLFFGGLIATFVTNWLSFVMMFSFPAFLECARQCGSAVRRGRDNDIKRLQQATDAALLEAMLDPALLETGRARQSGEASEHSVLPPTTATAPSVDGKANPLRTMSHHGGHGTDGPDTALAIAVGLSSEAAVTRDDSQTRIGKSRKPWRSSKDTTGSPGNS